MTPQGFLHPAPQADEQEPLMVPEPGKQPLVAESSIHAISGSRSFPVHTFFSVFVNATSAPASTTR